MSIIGLMDKYLPLVVAIISAFIAYSFGRLNENKKRLITMLEESLNKHYSVIYQKVIKIYCINDATDKVEAIKEYINYLVEESEMYNFYQEEINFFVLELYSKIKKNHIGEADIIKQFEIFSGLIEDEYWKRIRTQTKDLKWFINQNTMNRSIAFSLNILFRLKSTFDYLFSIAIFILFIMIYDRILQFGNTSVFHSEIRTIFGMMSIFVLTLYAGIYAIYFNFERKINYKIKRFF